MPVPPSPDGFVASHLQEALNQIREVLIDDLRGVMKDAQKESIDKHLKIINCQEELFLQTALEQLRAQIKSQEASLEGMLARILTKNNSMASPFSRQYTPPPWPQPPPLCPMSLPSAGKQDGGNVDASVLTLSTFATESEEASNVSPPESEVPPTEGCMSQSQAQSQSERFESKVKNRTSTLLTLADQSKPEPVKRETLFKTTGMCHKIVASPMFHGISALVICLNAVYMGIEADWNPASNLNDAPWPFQFFEHCFTGFFTVEVLINFGAFKNKKDSLKDAWFMLDAVMVIMMILETWVFSLVLALSSDGNAPNTGVVGGIGRMFRLLRLTRISKLMHVLPELATMVKGMIAAIRSVHVALIILVLQVYVFAIIMNVLIGNEEDVKKEFESVRASMVTLLLSGVLLDDISGLVHNLIDVGNVFSLGVFAIFVLLSALTVMNMLIGVLCEVVLEVSAEEKETMVKEQMQKTLLVMLQDLDADKSGQLSKSEVQSVIYEPAASKIMSDIQVDTEHLLDIIEMLYETEDSVLPISTIMSIVLSLRGKRPATMNDLAKGYNFMLWAVEAQFASHMENMKSEMESHHSNLKNSLTRQAGEALEHVHGVANSAHYQPVET